MSERTRHIAKLISENPELEIVALCSEECSNPDYSYMVNSDITGEIVECCTDERLNDERWYIRESDEEEILERLMGIDGHYNILPDVEWKKREPWGGWTYDPYKNGKLLTEEELEALAYDYLNNMPWQRVIALKINP